MPEQLRRYQVFLLQEKKLEPSTVETWISATWKTKSSPVPSPHMRCSHHFFVIRTASVAISPLLISSFWLSFDQLKPKI
jgi:hypothetical protein